MAERKYKSKAATIGLRLDPELLRQMREYANAHPFQPPLTGLINDALRDWIAKHKGEVKTAPHR
jgi:hypothetical protein